MYFCRIGSHVGEFESTFLCDLEGGQLSTKDYYCGLEGKTNYPVVLLFDISVG